MPRICLSFLALLFLAACGDKDAVCEEGARICDGDFLQECVDQTWEETDCSAEGMVCHDMGDESHCMTDDDMEM